MYTLYFCGSQVRIQNAAIKGRALSPDDFCRPHAGIASVGAEVDDDDGSGRLASPHHTSEVISRDLRVDGRCRDIGMAQQLLNRREWHRRAIQSIGRRIEQRLGKRMTEIMRTQRRRKFCCLAELGDDLTDAASRQGAALTEKKMSIWPPAPRSNSLSLNISPISPVALSAQFLVR